MSTIIFRINFVLSTSSTLPSMMPRIMLYVTDIVKGTVRLDLPLNQIERLLTNGFHKHLT